MTKNIKMMILCISAVPLLLTFTPLTHAARATAPELVALFDERGLSELRYGDTLLTSEYNKKQRVHLQYIQYLDPTEERGFKQIWAPKSNAPESFNIKMHELRQSYDWGELRLCYHVSGTRMDLDLTLLNDSDKTIQKAEVHVHPLELPRVPANSSIFPQRHLGIQCLEIDSGTLGLQGMTLYQPDHNSMLISGPRPAVKAFHPVVDDYWFSNQGDMIPPGESRTYHASLVVGPANASLKDLFPSVYSDEAKAHPQTLNWSDRRPIGSVFLCNANTHSKINPRGWFQGSKDIDITNEEGVKAFGERLMKYADNCIVNMQKMDAQGVIIWDIEGQEFYHPISDIGDPRPLDKLAPEMHRYADAFMKRFTDAGFKTGITIRPTEIFQSSKSFPQWNHREVSDPVAAMADKIRYARNRWGCTLFYLDSSVFGKDYIKGLAAPRNVPWYMPVNMLKALNTQFPDCLIIPEFASREAQPYSAPYGHCNLGQGGTDAVTRAIWPKAFKVVAVSDQLMQTRWRAYVAEVGGGDILLFRSWYNDPLNAFIKNIYREAAFINAGSPHSGTTSSWVKSTSAETRYQAAANLNPLKQQQQEQLILLLKDEDILVQRRALQTLATGPAITNETILAEWVTTFKAPYNAETAILRTDIGKLLAKAGDTIVPYILPLVNNRQLQSQAIRLLGQTNTDNPEVAQKLREIIADEKQGYHERTVAANAAGTLMINATVPELITVLKDPNRDSEFLRSAAVVALGKIGDPRGIPPIVEQLGKQYTTVVVYRIEREMDEALRTLTGVHGVIGRKAWTEWARTKKQAENLLNTNNQERK